MKIMEKTLNEWLTSGDTTPYRLIDGAWTYMVIRAEDCPDFEFLFVQEHYRSAGLTRDEYLRFAGLYCKKDCLVYDATYPLGNALPGAAERTEDNLKKQLQSAVRDKVEAVIKNDRKNLTVSEVGSDDWELRELSYLKAAARGAAKELFLNEDAHMPPAFQCDYTPAKWDDDSLRAYILDPDGYATKEAETYIANSQEKMLLRFLYNDAVEEAYQKIIADTQNPLHIVKKIREAVIPTSAKTVNVTLCKDGVEMTVKFDSDRLRHETDGKYSSFWIASGDRRAYKKQFGEYNGFTAKDILRITYARKVLYEAEEVEQA